MAAINLLAGLGLLTCLVMSVSLAQASSVGQRSIWLLEGGEVAVEMFDCNGLLCGRIIWLKLDETPAQEGGATTRLALCNQSVMLRLRAAGPGVWQDGALYDPRNGRTYNVSLKSQSADVLLARAYIGMPAFGETQVLRRVRELPPEGWCLPPNPLEAVDAAASIPTAVSAVTR